jgi:hypothetical protein
VWLDPLHLLLGLALTVLTSGVLLRAREARRSRRLADAVRILGWAFSDADRFSLAARVCVGCGIPGAADVLVEHVCYRSFPCGTWFVFTASYVVGTVRSRRRVERLLGWMEANGECTAVSGVVGRTSELAPGRRPGIADYLSMIEQINGAASWPPATPRDSRA